MSIYKAQLFFMVMTDIFIVIGLLIALFVSFTFGLLFMIVFTLAMMLFGYLYGLAEDYGFNSYFLIHIHNDHHPINKIVHRFVKLMTGKQVMIGTYTDYSNMFQTLKIAQKEVTL